MGFIGVEGEGAACKLIVRCFRDSYQPLFRSFRSPHAKMPLLVWLLGSVNGEERRAGSLIPCQGLVSLRRPL